MRLVWGLAVGMWFASMAIGGSVEMEKVNFGGWPNCIRLSNGKVELIATTDVGPRIVRFGFEGGQNLFKEYPEQQGKTGGSDWRIYGGHRLWHAPESTPRTYSPDNSPVPFEWDGKTLRLSQPVEPDTGIEKTIALTLDPSEARVNVNHTLTNRGMWSVELAPWCLSVMAQGGSCILPQEPFVAHTDRLLPVRPMALWGYTDMGDARWTWGTRYIQLRQDPNNSKPQKLGIQNTPGWAAYALNGELFIKRFPFVAGAEYPDFGSNTEAFTNNDMLEVESLGPQVKLAPGESTSFEETWSLFKKTIGTTDAEIDAAMGDLLK